jgi:hypothetical protein
MFFRAALVPARGDRGARWTKELSKAPDTACTAIAAGKMSVLWRRLQCEVAPGAHAPGVHHRKRSRGPQTAKRPSCSRSCFPRGTGAGCGDSNRHDASWRIASQRRTASRATATTRTAATPRRASPSDPRGPRGRRPSDRADGEPDGRRGPRPSTPTSCNRTSQTPSLIVFPTPTMDRTFSAQNCPTRM